GRALEEIDRLGLQPKLEGDRDAVGVAHGWSSPAPVLGARAQSCDRPTRAEQPPSPRWRIPPPPRATPIGAGATTTAGVAASGHYEWWGAGSISPCASATAELGAGIARRWAREAGSAVTGRRFPASAA